MKKYFYLLIAVSILSYLFAKAYADCTTGFACSIKDLEEKERIQLQNDIAVFRGYLLRENHSFNFINSRVYNENYENLFLFKSAL